MTDLTSQIEQILATEPVALFMKGTPAFVACGNSQRALQALRAAGAPVTAIDIPRGRGGRAARRWRDAQHDIGRRV